MSQTIELLTYADVLDHLIDFQRANPSSEHNRFARRAIHLALDNFRNDHQWMYYYKVGRICTNPPFSDGTVTYDKTGGVVERALTLTGAVWPDYATFSKVIIDQIIYDVAERISDSVVQLDFDLSPDADITTASSYQLMRDTYPLPSDFSNLDKLYTPQSWHQIEYVHPREWLVAHRYNFTSSNPPQWWTIKGSTDYIGSLELAFYPFPDSAQTIDFLYQRRPRPLRVERVAGTLNGSAGQTIATRVDGDVFLSEHIGSIIRVTDSDGTENPTGREGQNPYSEERTVMDVAGSQITIDQQWLKPHSNAKYVISDPVDIEPGALRSIFLRRAEMELAILTRMEDRNQLIQQYHEFLERHRGYAARTRAPRSVYTENVGYRRLAFMPSGPDVE